ncbi:MAG: ABC transporter substrate-binding protein [Thermomicrobiales bacterium]
MTRAITHSTGHDMLPESGHAPRPGDQSTGRDALPFELMTRRGLLGGLGAAAALVALPRLTTGQGTPAASEGTPVAAPALVEAVRIDLTAEPPTLDPALTYAVDGWSIVHSVYDTLVGFDASGTLRPLLAETMDVVDPRLLEFRLRPGITFHNGEPFDSRAVAHSFERLVDPALGSQVAGNFAVVEEVREIDALTVQFVLSAPAPYLPAQMAVWLAIVPPSYASDPSNDLGATPVGTGPYRFVAWERGERVELAANTDYALGALKGFPVAKTAEFRFLPDGATRVAELRAGAADLVTAVPADQVEAIEGDGLTVLPVAVSGSTWVRIATDVAPFDDPRVRRALNHAVDTPAIIAALLGGFGRPLASFAVPTTIGYDPALEPLAYDPALARDLLAEAGLGDGFETTMAVSIGDRIDIAEAIAGFLADIGVSVTVVEEDGARFNATWKDPGAAPLRLVTWRGIFDPYTLLNLVVDEAGFLSRYRDEAVQAVLDAAATEQDPAVRAGQYAEVFRLLREEPAAIYLSDVTAINGLGPSMPAWTPRADGYVLPTVVPGG